MFDKIKPDLRYNAQVKDLGLYGTTKNSPYFNFQFQPSDIVAVGLTSNVFWYIWAKCGRNHFPVYSKMHHI